MDKINRISRRPDKITSIKIDLLLTFSAAIIHKMITVSNTIHGYIIIRETPCELEADSQLGIEKMRLILKLTKQHYESTIEEDVAKAYYQDMLLTLKKEVSDRQEIAKLALAFVSSADALVIQNSSEKLGRYWQDIEELSHYYPS